MLYLTRIIQYRHKKPQGNRSYSAVFCPSRVGATMDFGIASVAAIFQFTPPRGGRPSMVCPALSRGAISIHAPAWGATPEQVNALRLVDISIHAPAWGATSSRSNAAGFFDFNSRPRVGGDLMTPTRTMRATYFNSRPRVGGDYLASSPPQSVNNFNSRPRVGGDSKSAQKGAATIVRFAA